MTDNEIVKALECCVQGYCRRCAFDDGVNFNCNDNLMNNALDLINRQKTEIERLQADKIIAERHEKDARELFKNTVLQLETAESEAIKEFAERLKERSYDPQAVIHDRVYRYYDDDIDNLVKEMTEENNG